MPAGRISTKIALLDEVLGGGLEPASAVVYWSDKEVESSSLAYQTLYNRLREGDAGVVVATTKKPRQVLEAIKELGFDLTSLPLVFVDAFTAMYEGKTDERFFLKSSTDVEELVTVVGDAVRTQRGRHTLLVFDSFSAYIDRFEPVTEGLVVVSKLLQLFKENNATGIFVFTEWTYEPNLLDKVRQAFNVVVSLEAAPQRPVYSMQVALGPLLGPATSRRVFFKVLKPGGVKVYLPKILVTGPFHAGKTSFIHSASKDAVSADRLGTTVALDYGHVVHAGFVIELFGTPGQSRFDPLLEKVGGQAVGLVIVLSATDRPGLVRVREQMRLAKAEHLPYVIVVNKVNLRGALSLSAIRGLMKIPKKVPLIPMHAKNLAEVRPGLPCELNPRDVENALDAVIEQVEKAHRIGKRA